MKCVHLDFHTSPDIEGIGKSFDKEEFTKVVKEAKVDLMTVFAKCHHGYTYYPSEVDEMHPHLDFDLLQEEIDAIHAAGAKAPIYITMGWSKKDADAHPEWHQYRFDTKRPAYMGSEPSEDLDAVPKDVTWTTLCPTGEYLDFLSKITHEVCQKFDVADGIFYDICFIKDACACPNCTKGMIEEGLDPENYADARKYYIQKHVEMMKVLTGIVHEYSPDAPVFYNGGADMNRTEYHPYQTHYELEDLPTAWGGYDVMPLRAKFFEKYGKHFLGMTGKFHHAWGEFGGFKNKDALKYECIDMISVGASISVGDHLHPSGKIDKSTYATIGYAFDYIDRIEKYCDNTFAYSDIAIWLSHNKNADLGASKLLQIMHLDYDVVESGDDISKYSCIVLPDHVKLSEDDKRALVEFTAGGGKIVASYASIFDELGIEKIAPSECDQDYIECPIDEYQTPFLAYSSAYKTRVEGGEVLASVYEPYFNRTFRHFCGHKNTPNKADKAEYPAMVRKGNVLYFAHPIFTAYNASGNYVLEKYIMKGIDTVYDRYIKTENLPSCGRIRYRRRADGEHFTLHVLYAPPVNRGNVCLLCDFPTLHDVRVSVKVDKKITEVVSQPDGKKLDFVQNGDVVTISLDPFSLHKLVVLK